MGIRASQVGILPSRCYAEIRTAIIAGLHMPAYWGPTAAREEARRVVDDIALHLRNEIQDIPNGFAILEEYGMARPAPAPPVHAGRAIDEEDI